MQPSSASVFGSPASGIKFLLESMDGLGVLQVPAFVQLLLSSPDWLMVRKGELVLEMRNLLKITAFLVGWVGRIMCTMHFVWG